MVSPLVSPTWLRQHVLNGLRNIRILDASWHMDKTRNAREEYQRERIEGAVFFDIDEVSDHSSPFPHMLPSPQQFGEQVGKLGVHNDHHIVVYDNNDQHGLFSAPRVWWMFRVFGHRNISILDGGLPRWKFRGFPTTHGPPDTISVTSYAATFDPRLVRTLQQMLDNFSTREEQVVDARSSGRFQGTKPEPRPSLPSGHMIGAHNLPYFDLLSDSNILKNKHQIQEEFEKAGVDLAKPVVASCGSGITAAVLAFGAHMIGNEIPIYDGSWTEWVQSAPEDTMTLGVKGEEVE